MQNQQSIEEQVREVIAFSTQKDINEVTVNTLFSELALKSIQYIGLCALLEEKLSIAPNFRELMSMTRVGDVVQYIKGQIKE